MKEKRLILKKLREKDKEIKALKKIAQVSPPNIKQRNNIIKKEQANENQR